MSEAGEPRLTEIAAPPAAAGWEWGERLLIRLGDRLNPIVVKEVRQALKSRQFLITFTLLLICGWVWSILGLGWQPQAAYAPAGAYMLIGYYLILAFPLVVIVPFGAFRSLAIEQEDRTYELLSITALNPRQIIAGKLCCTVAQMIIYLSAISPCLAFTYLLRGIDVVTIVFAIALVFAVSLGLSVISLMIGTLSNERHWQLLLTVALIVGLLLAFWLSSIGGVVLIQRGLSVDRAEFWQGLAAIVTAYLSYFAIFFYAAVARITFASDNRSTRLRVLMVAQQVLFIGWMSFVAQIATVPLVGVFMLTLLGLLFHWAIMGIFMTSESPVLSLRARRNLPQSLLGRMLFTWFNPGPATGYVFAVAGAISGVLVVGAGTLFSRALFPVSTMPGMTPLAVDVILAFGVLGVCYLAIYLGMGVLLLRGLRRMGQSGPLLAVLVYLVLIMMGCGLPVLVKMSISGANGVSYSILQAPNFPWTLGRLLGSMSLPADMPVLLTILPLTAMAVLLLNLPGIIRELEYVRLAKPSRVAEEDAEAEARLHPPELVQTSPWDSELRSW